MRQRKCTTKVGEVYHKFRRGVPLIVTKIRYQPATHVKDIQRKCPTNFGEVSYLRFLESPDFTEFWILHFIVIIRRSVVPVFSSKLSYFIYVIVC